MFVVLAEGFNMFRLGPVAAGGNMKPSDSLPFTKRIVVGWSSGSWTQEVWIAFSEDPYDLRGIIWAEGFRDCGRWAVPIYQLWPEICVAAVESNGNTLSGKVSQYPSPPGEPLGNRSLSVTINPTPELRPNQFHAIKMTLRNVLDRLKTDAVGASLTGTSSWPIRDTCRPTSTYSS
jgi:hypothetical protein